MKTDKDTIPYKTISAIMEQQAKSIAEKSKKARFLISKMRTNKLSSLFKKELQKEEAEF